MHHTVLPYGRAKRRFLKWRYIVVGLLAAVAAGAAWNFRATINYQLFTAGVRTKPLQPEGPVEIILNAATPVSYGNKAPAALAEHGFNYPIAEQIAYYAAIIEEADGSERLVLLEVGIPKSITVVVFSVPSLREHLAGTRPRLLFEQDSVTSLTPHVHEGSFTEYKKRPIACSIDHASYHPERDDVFLIHLLHEAGNRVVEISLQQQQVRLRRVQDDG